MQAVRRGWVSLTWKGDGFTEAIKYQGRAYREHSHALHWGRRMRPSGLDILDTLLWVQLRIGTGVQKNLCPWRCRQSPEQAGIKSVLSQLWAGGWTIPSPRNLSSPNGLMAFVTSTSSTQDISLYRQYVLKTLNYSAIVKTNNPKKPQYPITYRPLLIQKLTFFLTSLCRTVNHLGKDNRQELCKPVPSIEFRRIMASWVFIE